jgi:hypothetical protein
MSYGRVKQKSLFPSQSLRQMSCPSLTVKAMLGRDRRDPDRHDDVAWIADFLKQLRRAWAKTGRRCHKRA